MTEQHDFWLQLHHLTVAYKAMGANPDERAAALARQFNTKGKPAQRQAADEALMMATALSNLYTHANLK
jgi:hypothetical protein